MRQSLVLLSFQHLRTKKICAAVYFYAAALQASAHSLHACAHAWQWSCSCLLHSSAHASQSSIHSCNKCLPCLESLANNTAVVLQTSAQSKLLLMHLAIICTCSSCRQAEAQKLHAAIQISSFFMSWSFGIIFIFIFLDNVRRCCFRYKVCAFNFYLMR